MGFVEKKHIVESSPRLSNALGTITAVAIQTWFGQRMVHWWLQQSLSPTLTLYKGDVFQQLRRSLRGRCARASAPDVPAGGCATILNDAAAAEDTVAIVAL